jgi:hypothetical protein
VVLLLYSSTVLSLDVAAPPTHDAAPSCLLAFYPVSLRLQLLHKRQGAEDYDAAALLLDHAVH